MDKNIKLTKKEKEQLQPYKLSRKRVTKDFKFCKICGVASDGFGILKEEVEKYLKKPRFLKNHGIVCENCKTGLKSSVNLICNGVNPVTNKKCSSVYGFDEEVIKKYLPDVKSGDGLEIYGCPKCTKEKKFKFTN